MDSAISIILVLLGLIVLSSMCPRCADTILKPIVHNNKAGVETFRTAYCDTPQALRLQQLPLSDFHADFARDSKDFRLAI